MYAHLPLWEQNNNMSDTLLPCFKKIRRVKQFFWKKNISSSVNDAVHILKPTQMVQSVIKKRQLLHFILKSLKIPELFGYDTAASFQCQTRRYIPRFKEIFNFHEN